MRNISIQRTTITVPTDLVEDLKKMTDTSTKTQAVILAIQEEIKRRKLQNFRSLAGKFKPHSSILKTRHHDHRLR